MIIHYIRLLFTARGRSRIFIFCIHFIRVDNFVLSAPALPPTHLDTFSNELLSYTKNIVDYDYAKITDKPLPTGLPFSDLAPLIISLNLAATTTFEK